MKIKILFSLILIIISATTSSWGQCCRCCRAGNELIKNGDFSLGNVGFTSAYTFLRNSFPGRYGIVTDSRTANPTNWASCKDHTSGTGNFIWFDLSTSPDVIMWTQKINNITPNANYFFHVG